jgi:hypothetical protein
VEHGDLERLLGEVDADHARAREPAIASAEDAAARNPRRARACRRARPKALDVGEPQRY